MTKMLQPGDVLTAKEAAQLLRVNIKTLERWEKAGKLIPTRLPGGRKRFHRDTIEALITDRVAP